MVQNGLQLSRHGKFFVHRIHLSSNFESVHGKYARSERPPAGLQRVAAPIDCFPEGIATAEWSPPGAAETHQTSWTPALRPTNVMRLCPLTHVEAHNQCRLAAYAENSPAMIMQQIIHISLGQYSWLQAHRQVWGDAA